MAKPIAAVAFATPSNRFRTAVARARLRSVTSNNSASAITPAAAPK